MRIPACLVGGARREGLWLGWGRARGLCFAILDWGGKGGMAAEMGRREKGEGRRVSLGRGVRGDRERWM